MPSLNTDRLGRCGACIRTCAVVAGLAWLGVAVSSPGTARECALGLGIASALLLLAHLIAWMLRLSGPSGP